MNSGEMRIQEQVQQQC